MIIRDPDLEPRPVDDYDFTLTGGLLLPVTIDRQLGDTIDFTPQSIDIHLAAKPSKIDASVMLGEENHSIFSRHVISVRHVKRLVQDIPKEVKEEWTRTMQELGGSVGSKMTH